MTDIFPESREEEILVSTINGEEYDKAPESRIEALLLELKEVIEEGGGGGGTTNYNLLQNKPSINSVTLTGDKSLEDLEIPTAADLAGKQDALPVAASGNDVAFNGDIQDGQGNTLSVLAEALTKTASGNPVVITDCAGGKARSLKTTIEPIQDLHGLPFPYVGGAYKNKAFESSGNNKVIAHIKANTTYTFSLKVRDGISVGFNLFQNSDSGTLIANVSPYTPTTFTVTEDCDLYLNGFSLTEGTSFASATSEFQLEIGQTATTYAPYENICPISGRTAVAVDDVGKNQWNYGIATGSGSNSFENSHPVYGNPITVHVKRSNGTGQINYKVYNPDGTTAYNDAALITANNTVANLTIPNNIDGLYLVLYGINGATSEVITELQVAAESSYSSYEPYAHSSATIQLGQTVYGADINWDTGVATVTDAIFDLGNNNYTYNGGVGQFYTGELIDGAENIAGGRDGKCSIYKIEHPTDTASLSDGAITFLNRSYGVGKTIWIKDSRFTNPADLKTALSGQTLVYPLATPTTIQLTPEQLQMLKGYNRVTIDNGSIELGYIAKAISGNDEEEIAPTVGDKATKAYAVNDFIERADGLYRVTAPIASGASFTANNTVKMSIGEALTYLYNK